MNKYTINGQSFSTNLDANKIYAISKPIVSFPFSFTNQIRTLTQDFIVGVNNVPEYNPSLKHPTYPKAYITSQSEANVEPMGFCRFTRSYIEFLQDEIVFPKQMSITYPSIFSTTNFKKRGFKETTPEGIPIAEFMEQPVPLRANPLTLVVPVEEKIELIYIGNGVRDTTTEPKDVPVGSTITYQGKDWYVNSNIDGVVDLTRTNEDGEEEQTTAVLNRNNYQYFVYDPDFTKIAPDFKYVINDTYQGIRTDVYNASQVSTDVNPHATEVDFVDDKTAPNHLGYLQMAEDKTKVTLQTSTFEHLGGYVYLKKTIQGYLR